MRRTGGVGAAALSAVVLVLVAGCSDGGGNSSADEKPRGVASLSPEPLAAPAPVEEDPYPATPEGDFDRMADEKGWTDFATSDSASAFVTDMCESLPISAIDGASRPQWLAGYLEGDSAAVLDAGIPKFCPEWTKSLKQSESGKFDIWFADGSYEVKKNPGPADPDTDQEEIGPGTYRSKGDLENCYWERSNLSGDIIDNHLATAARSVTVTVRAKEMFTTRDCGTWKPVK